MLWPRLPLLLSMPPMTNSIIRYCLLLVLLLLLLSVVFKKFPQFRRSRGCNERGALGCLDPCEVRSLCCVRSLPLLAKLTGKNVRDIPVAQRALPPQHSGSVQDSLRFFCAPHFDSYSDSIGLLQLY